MRKGMPVEINGLYFDSMNDASIKLGMVQGTIKNRCINKNFPNYKFVKYQLPYKLLCRKCFKEKNIEEFKKDKSRKTGRSSWCKVCHSKYTVLNTDRRMANTNNKNYKKTIKGKITSLSYKSSRRQKEKIQLSKEERIDLRWYYATAKFLRDAGIDMTVDHKIPLSKGGLHHPSNLQLMLRKDNIRKNAKILT